MIQYIAKSTATDFTTDTVWKFSNSFKHHAPGVTWPWSAHKEDKSTVPSDHTSGTPSPCCPEGRPAMLIKCGKKANNSLPGESSATLRCSGSGRHGCTFEEIYNNLHRAAHHQYLTGSDPKMKSDSHMPQATVHSSLVAEAWLAWHSMQRSMMWFLKS